MEIDADDVGGFALERFGFENLDKSPLVIGDFEKASERLELSVNSVALIARGMPMDSAISTLSVLQNDHEEYGRILHFALDKINLFSEGRITWEHGRGSSGLFGAESPNPGIFKDVFLSAHEAALRISRMALEFFFLPFEGIANKVERESAFQKRLIDPRRWALKMSMDEVTEWQSRIRLERTKYINEQDKNVTQKTKSRDFGAESDSITEGNKPPEPTCNYLDIILNNDRKSITRKGRLCPPIQLSNQQWRLCKLFVESELRGASREQICRILDDQKNGTIRQAISSLRCLIGDSLGLKITGGHGGKPRILIDQTAVSKI